MATIVDGFLQLEDIHEGKPHKPKEKADGETTVQAPHTSAELGRIAESAMRQYTGQLSGALTEASQRAIVEAVVRARRDGTGVQGVQDSISGLFSADRAKRIAVTETSRLFGAGAQAQYRAWGMQKWEWSTCNDPWVCEECQGREGEQYDMSEAFEPAHTGCRCFPRPIEVEGPAYEREYASAVADADSFVWAGQNTDDILSMPREQWEAIPTAWDQLERWAAANGVDIIDFSNGDLLTRLQPGVVKSQQIARGIAEARRAIKEAGFVPDSVHWQLHNPRTWNDDGTVADAWRNEGVVRINVGSQNWGKNAQEFVDNVVRTHWWPEGAKPESSLVHEMAHLAQDPIKFAQYPGWELVALDIKGPLLKALHNEGFHLETQQQRELALRIVVQQVSLYALKNPHEFVAEMFEGMVSGNHYGPDAMALYQFLGGPEVP